VSALGKLGALVQQNKRPIGIAGAAAVGGLALMQARKRDGGAAGAPGSPVPAGQLPVNRSPHSAGGQPTYGYPVGYTHDSTSQDLMTALQPQIEYLQRLSEKQNETPAVPVPTPGPMTNREWLNRATTKWAQLGHNPIDIQAALGQYLGGQGINRHQADGVGWAVREFGAAPEGTAGTSPIVG
jgi:hypothetical protein